MGIRKKANKFGKELRNVMMDHGGMGQDVLAYVMLSELVAMYTHDDPKAGLNEMMNMVVGVAAEQGFKITFGPPPTMH